MKIPEGGDSRPLVEEHASGYWGPNWREWFLDTLAALWLKRLPE